MSATSLKDGWVKFSEEKLEQEQEQELSTFSKCAKLMIRLISELLDLRKTYFQVFEKPFVEKTVNLRKVMGASDRSLFFEKPPHDDDHDDDHDHVGARQMDILLRRFLVDLETCFSGERGKVSSEEKFLGVVEKFTPFLKEVCKFGSGRLESVRKRYWSLGGFKRVFEKLQKNAGLAKDKNVLFFVQLPSRFEMEMLWVVKGLRKFVKKEKQLDEFISTLGKSFLEKKKVLTKYLVEMNLLGELEVLDGKQWKSVNLSFMKDSFVVRSYNLIHERENWYELYGKQIPLKTVDPLVASFKKKGNNDQQLLFKIGDGLVLRASSRVARIFWILYVQYKKDEFLGQKKLEKFFSERLEIPYVQENCSECAAWMKHKACKVLMAIVSVSSYSRSSSSVVPRCIKLSHDETMILDLSPEQVDNGHRIKLREVRKLVLGKRTKPALLFDDNGLILSIIVSPGKFGDDNIWDGSVFVIQFTSEKDYFLWVKGLNFVRADCRGKSIYNCFGESSWAAKDSFRRKLQYLRNAKGVCYMWGEGICLGERYRYLDREFPKVVTPIMNWNVKNVFLGCSRVFCLAKTVSNDSIRTFVWGDNRKGALGVPGIKKTTKVLELTGIGTVVDVKCGRFHTLFLNSKGEVYGCGSNEFGNLLGKDFEGTQIAEHYAKESESKCVFYPVKLLDNVTSIETGSYHSGVVRFGILRTFGKNVSGQLGLGKKTKFENVLPSIPFCGGKSLFYGDSSKSKSIEANKGRNERKIIELQFGETHSIILLSNGDCFSFGDNRYGQCGRSNTKSNEFLVPTVIPHLQTTHVSRISSGNFHVGCIDKSHNCFVWGKCGSENVFVPRKITQIVVKGIKLNVSKSFFSERSKEKEIFRFKFTQIACGGDHSIVVVQSDSKRVLVASFGKGTHGVLGLRSEENVAIPTKIPMFFRFISPYEENLISIRAGYSSSSCLCGSVRHDLGISNCFICRHRFSFKRRKHTCRECGVIVCVMCTKFVDEDRKSKRRVCSFCFLIFDTAARVRKDQQKKLHQFLNINPVVFSDCMINNVPVF